MDSSELLAQFRLDARDTVRPYLWSDEEVYLYLNEAQRTFCRLTGGLADASSHVARLQLKANKRYAEVSPLVLKLRAAFGEESRKLELLNFEDIEFDSSRGRELFTDTPGSVHSLVLGMEPHKVRVINTPTEDQVVNLTIYRYPLDDINGPDQALEVDEQHHVPLLKWARHLAHMKPDAETFDRGRADQYKLDFETYCRMASEEKGRREHKYRAVQFSW